MSPASATLATITLNIAVCLLQSFAESRSFAQPTVSARADRIGMFNWRPSSAIPARSRSLLRDPGFAEMDNGRGVLTGTLGSRRTWRRSAVAP